MTQLYKSNTRLATHLIKIFHFSFLLTNHPNFLYSCIPVERIVNDYVLMDTEGSNPFTGHKRIPDMANLPPCIAVSIETVE